MQTVTRICLKQDDLYICMYIQVAIIQYNLHEAVSTQKLQKIYIIRKSFNHIAYIFSAIEIIS